MSVSPAEVVPTAPTRVRMTDLGILAGILLALAWVYGGALRGLLDTWSRSPMYSYGYTVPVISAYLLWARRGALADALPPRPSLVAGTVGMFAALTLTLVAAAASVQLFAQIAFLVALGAAVLLVFGVRVLAAAWAAYAYLLLMIPIWDVFTEPLHWPFQLRSAEYGVAVLQAFGIPVFREGTLVTLPNVAFEVARACSGVNYLIAVLALGLPLAYLFVDGFLRRAAVIGMAIVIAAASNALRIALIGLLAYLNIGSPLHGPFHVLHGLFVASIGYVALFAGVRMLGRRETLQVPARDAELPRSFPRLSVAWGVGTAAAIAAIGVCVAVQRPAPVPLRVPLDRLPVVLGDWRLSRQPPMTGGQSWWPGADDELLRRYVRADGVAATVYVGYFAVQQQRREVVSYQSAPLHSRATPVVIAMDGVAVLTANAVARLGDDASPALFWYELDGVVETGEMSTKVRTLRNALLRRRSDAAVVMISSEPGGRRSTTATMSQLQELAVLVYDALRTQLPGGETARHVRADERDAPVTGSAPLDALAAAGS